MSFHLGLEAKLFLRKALKKAVSEKLFVTLSSVGIATIKVETKRKIFNRKFQTLAKRKIVSQSEVCG